MTDPSATVVVMSGVGGSGVSNQPNTQHQPSGYRQCLLVAVAALLNESGFDSATKLSLESLAEVIQSFVVELGRSARAFTELACRTEPLGADVLLALTEMGFPSAFSLVNGLRDYAFRTNRKTLGVPQMAPVTKPPTILHTGDRKKKVTAGTSGGGVNVVPEYLPDFPDSHSYTRTPTHKQPSHDDYAGVREKAASQKRDVERALTRFIAKTSGKTHSLFNTNDTNLFPLISCDQTARLSVTVSGAMGQDGGHQETSADMTSFSIPPYINALLFRDQIFEEDEREFLPKKRKLEETEKKNKKKKKRKDEEESLDKDESEVETRKEEDKKEKSRDIENPFLKPVRLPRCSLPPLIVTPVKKEK